MEINLSEMRRFLHAVPSFFWNRFEVRQSWDECVFAFYFTYRGEQQINLAHRNEYDVTRLRIGEDETARSLGVRRNSSSNTVGRL